MKRLEKRHKTYKLNVDDNPQSATQYGITGIPTVLVFKNGKIDQTLVGVRDESTYMNALGVSQLQEVEAK